MLCRMGGVGTGVLYYTRLRVAELQKDFTCQIGISSPSSYLILKQFKIISDAIGLGVSVSSCTTSNQGEIRHESSLSLYHAASFCLGNMARFHRAGLVAIETIGYCILIWKVSLRLGCRVLNL